MKLIDIGLCLLSADLVVKQSGWLSQTGFPALPFLERHLVKLGSLQVETVQDEDEIVALLGRRGHVNLDYAGHSLPLGVVCFLS